MDPGVGNIQWQTSAASQSPQFPLASHNADVHHLFNLIRLLILLLLLLILLIFFLAKMPHLQSNTSSNTAANTSNTSNTFLASHNADIHSLANLMLQLILPLVLLRG